MPRSKKMKERRRKFAKEPSSIDRLRLLPPEIRSIIYNFVSEALVVHVRKSWGGREQSHETLALPGSKKHTRFSKENFPKEGSFWSPAMGKAFSTALAWTWDRGIPLYNWGSAPTPDFASIMIEIIYKLSGERLFNQAISCLLTASNSLKAPANARTVLDNDSRKTKRTLEKIRKDCNVLLGPAVAKSASVESLLQSVQDMASQLPFAVQADRELSSLMDQPNPTLNGSVNIFRELSRMVTVSDNDFRIYLDTPVPSFYFSLYSVSRFYRIDALPNLASRLTWDFGNDIATLQNFNQRLSPGSQCYLRHVNITRAEGFMFPKESQPLNTERSFCDHINTALPNLRILDVDLWPRDPTRTDTGSRAWDEQSDVLIKCLHYVKAKVKLRLRWAADCERFERKHVRKGGWKCVWKDGPHNQSKEIVGFSPRCYELYGSGDKEEEYHSSEI